MDRRFLLFVLGTGIIFLLSPMALAASPLDGTQWRVEITPKGAEIPHYIDRLGFKEGKFTSVIFERKGFLSSPYTLTDKKGGPIVWEVKQKSEAEGDLSWQGELKGDAMSGTVSWKQADGTVVDHTFTGSPAKEEPPTPEVTEPPAPEPKPKAPAPKASAPKAKKAPPSQ